MILIGGQARCERARPAQALKPRRDLRVIQVSMVTAARADQLEEVSVATLGPALHYAHRLASQARRVTMRWPIGYRNG
jgi:hypothetical protein